MVLSRRFISSRPVVALFVLLAVFLLVGWGYSLSLWNKTLNFYLGLLVLNPIIIWSLYEIFRLRKRKFGWIFWIYFLINYSLVLTPICLLPIYELNLGYRCLIVVFCLIILWGLCRLSSLGGNWIDFEILFRGKSFTNLILCSCLFWNSLFSLLYYSKWLLVLLVFILVMLNDSFALLFGKVFGRRALSIYSRYKTKEGMWGSVVFVSCLVAIALFTIPEGWRECLLGRKSYWWVSFPLVVTGLLIGNWGDLYFSMHKRIYGIKDYSGLLGSHGGFWDRFDSLCFVIIFVIIITIFWRFVE